MARNSATRLRSRQPFPTTGRHQRIGIHRSARRLRRRQPADDHRELAARAAELRCDLGRRADQDLLVALGELTRGRDAWRRAPARSSAAQQGRHAMRRLVQDQRQLGTPLPRPGADPAPWRARMPDGRAGSRRTRSPAPPRRTGQWPRSPPHGPGTTSTAAPASRAAATRARTGVGDTGHARIGGQRQRLAGRQPRQQPAAGALAPLCSLKDCVGVRAPTWARSRAASRVSSATTRSAVAQRLGGARREVTQVADRRADDQEPAVSHSSRGASRDGAAGRGGRSPACAG